MGILSGNSCSIITILPLGGVCNVINTSTPQSTNGLISLVVTGGTSPYDVRWDNGQIGTTLTNLSTGTYKATIIDYYGDYTATTFCTVGNTSFYLEKFENCSDNTSYVYYTANLTNPEFTPSKVYKLTTQNGCWISSGITLYSGQTYISDYAQKQLNIGGPYNTCELCLPTVPPTPVYSQNLCLQSTLNSNTTQINFSSGSTINGTPSWTSVTPNYVIYYNNSSARWLLSGITLAGGGIVYRQNPSIPPIGSWTVTGPSSGSLSINLTSGICGAIPLNFLSLTTNNPQNNTLLGSVNMVGNGGVPGYTYSINGINYQQGGVFNLGYGSYVAYVKDSNGTVHSQSFTLSAPIITSYQLNITNTNNPMAVNGTLSSLSTQSFNFSVNPPLPVGKTISFKLQTIFSLTGYTSGVFSPTFTANQTTTNISNPLTTSNHTLITIPRPGCLSTPGNVNKSGVTFNYNTVTIVGGSSLPTGTVSLGVSTPTVISSNPGSCPTFGNIKCSINVSNISITPSTNNVMVSSTLTPIVFPLQLTGTITP